MLARFSSSLPSLPPLLHCSFPQLRSVRFSPEPSSGNHPKTFPLARPMLSQSVPKGGKTLNVSTFSIIPAKGKAGIADQGGGPDWLLKAIAKKWQGQWPGACEGVSIKWQTGFKLPPGEAFYCTLSLRWDLRILVFGFFGTACTACGGGFSPG